MEGMDLKEGIKKIRDRLTELNSPEIAILLGFKKLVQSDNLGADITETIEEMDWAFSMGVAYYYEKPVSAIVLRNVLKHRGYNG
jgi:hypothetical protein